MKLAFLGFLLPAAALAQGLDGQIGIHDPSTVVRCNNRFYTYGTGGTSLVSDDGWTWRRGIPLPRRGLAPDVIHIGDRYYVYVAANIGAQPKAAVNMIWTRTLDPESPDYKWEEGGVVASSDGVEDSNAIDPGVFLDPSDGRLWLVYGSYFGYIRLVELDPRTGTRKDPGDTPRDLAINCEAATMIFHDGFYYLLATHGSCCRGADSGYNIRVGRSRKVTGPFLDHTGIDMIRGGGLLLVGSGGRVIGPGHFGLLDLGDGVQRFSLHYEADLDRGGASVLDIRPLLWRDGWPVAGDNLAPGTYAIESVRTGTALELAVEGMPVGGRRVRPGPPPSGGGPPGSGGGFFAGTGSPIPPQDVTQVSAQWPAGNVDVRVANYLCQAQQKWAITAVPGAGGYPWIALLPDPGRRHRTHAVRVRRCGARRPSRFHGRARAAVAYRAAPRWRLAHHAQGGAGLERAAGSFRRGRELPDPGEARSRERQAAVADQGAMKVRRGLLAALLGTALSTAGAAQTATPTLSRPTTPESAPAADGFIQRWLRLEPIAATGLTDSAVQAAVKKEYFPDQLTVVPHDGDTVTVGDAPLRWHAVDTKLYNVNLFHFARAQGKPTSNVLVWAVTVVHSPEEAPGVRLAIGSNAASVWWVNGQEVIGIYGDRQTVIDDGVSRRLTLKKGPNVIRAAIVNGGGATDFCARLLDAEDRPLTALTIRLP